MKIDERVSSLKRKHDALEKSLHDETIRPQPDDKKVGELKKMKLALKQEIEQLSASH
ncbi:MAG: YdcH family protein [Alphaproteobacteria bacterium]